jgi:mono/diheme cytochrome c family protein
MGFSLRLWFCLLTAVLLSAPAMTAAQTREIAGSPTIFGIGRAATAAEIARWNLDVMPDGTGLPDGRGTAAEGASIYARQCANCHGDDGQKGRDWLVGRQPNDAFPFGAETVHRQTIGSYWPYATSLFDYIRRAMPPTAAGSLGDDQVYAVTAHLLHLNGIIDADMVMNAESLAQVRMPARDRFVPDDRRGGAEVR